MNNLESYKHKDAKQYLADWLSGEYVTKTEVPFYIGDLIAFVPDVVCYDKGVPFAFWEVIHASDITGKKLGRIQSWSYRNNIQVSVYGIQAEWIMTRTEQPDKLEYIDYTIII